MAPIRHRIFISHSHFDNEFGIKLAQDLRRVLNEEDAVFYDVLGMHGGDEWWEKIVEELTAREFFLLVHSQDAMNSQWVRREIAMALIENKKIIPLLHRPYTIRTDLKTLQNISFLPPKSYETAFQEILSALGLPQEIPLPAQKTGQSSDLNEATTILMQQLEKAFGEHDWSDVIRKFSYLIKYTPGKVSSTVYHMQGVALMELGETQQAQEAFEIALALVSDRQQRLTLLSDYTTLLARQDQWTKVLQQAKEALHLVPGDPGWLAIQQQAQSKLAEPTALPPALTPSQKMKETTDQKLPPMPQRKGVPPSIHWNRFLPGRPVLLTTLVLLIIIGSVGLALASIPRAFTAIPNSMATAHTQATMRAAADAYAKYVSTNGMMAGFNAQRTRVNPYEQILSPPTVSGLTKQWAYQTGSSVNSSPAVANGLVYVSSKDGNLYAIDATSGHKKWEYQTGNAIFSSPAVANGIVYVGSRDRNLYAIDATSGQKKWVFQTGGNVDSSPAVANGLVYVGSNDGSLYAIDAFSGHKKWEYPTGNFVGSSPAVANGLIYVGSKDGNLYAVDASSGQKKWAYQTRDIVYSSPAVANGVVYVGSDDTNLYAFGLAMPPS